MARRRVQDEDPGRSRVCDAVKDTARWPDAVHEGRTSSATSCTERRIPRGGCATRLRDRGRRAAGVRDLRCRSEGRFGRRNPGTRAHPGGSSGRRGAAVARGAPARTAARRGSIGSRSLLRLVGLKTRGCAYRVAGPGRRLNSTGRRAPRPLQRPQRASTHVGHELGDATGHPPPEPFAAREREPGRLRIGEPQRRRSRRPDPLCEHVRDAGQLLSELGKTSRRWMAGSRRRPFKSSPSSSAPRSRWACFGRQHGRDRRELVEPLSWTIWKRNPRADRARLPPRAHQLTGSREASSLSGNIRWF